MARNPELSQEAVEARRAYRREWSRRNRDKVKAAQARYWERKAQRGNANGCKDQSNETRFE